MSRLHSLAEEQTRAVQPEDNIWLSASAGTGKTQVLTARVFRLLLRENVDPEHLLCLTFTKAGAAEMAERIRSQLAAWVRMPQKDLRQDLHAIGASNDPATQERARTLFARVLDARGGGLRIMTIHSFCQSLLASFPEEAGIASLFRPLEERDQKILAREALADMLQEEETSGRTDIIQAVQALSVRMGEDAAEQFLMRCAQKADAMEFLPARVVPFVRGILNLPIEEDPVTWLTDACQDEKFDRHVLQALQSAMAGSGGKKEQERQLVIGDWLAADPKARAQNLQELHEALATKSAGTVYKPTKGLLEALPDYDKVAGELVDWSSELRGKATLFQYADLLAGALEAGRAFYFRYRDAKRLRGGVDFDDMIRMTAKLLRQGDMAEWIRYKLDQRTDHILVDEAQDTNLAQWDIVHALADEFFAGLGASGDRLRTLFTVGDFKQAIFGFQGTSPHNYTQARDDFFERAKASGRSFKSLSLDRSFRSTPPVLEVVDRTFEQIGYRDLGLGKAIRQHRSFFDQQPGSVTLWKPVIHGINASEGDDETWLEDEKRVFAQRLADQIKWWLSPDNGLWLSQKKRFAKPQDIMILVSKRDELSALIVARLFAENIPVAGIDRIRLNQPLVVQDLLASIRFVLQPHDDLNLASLLVSPLLGWSHDDLLKHGYRGPKHNDKSLWDFLKAGNSHGEAIEALRDLLNMADFNTPYQFLETILSGPMQGRMKLLARLSHAALDPMEELMNLALEFEQNHVPTLQGFLDWFDRGDVEIKRDQGEVANEVRLMTVHGAKGLQAPVVVLANATFDPANKQHTGFDIPLGQGIGANLDYPLVPPRKAERVGVLAEHADYAAAREMEEHWRLLYVAMTRAEEHLFAGGVLGPRARGRIPDSSWHAAIGRGLESLERDEQSVKLWGTAQIYAMKALNSARKVVPADHDRSSLDKSDLPGWLYQPAPQESRPPRPLTPSDPGIDDAINPPAGIAGRKAMERGKLLHSLFQRLPDIAPERRADVADRWLENQKGIADPAERQELAEEVLQVLGHPQWAGFFNVDALAEAPVAAVVDDYVISGTVDRLVIEDNRILVIDFKTGRKLPRDAGDVPSSYLRQMAAYRAALQKIFPDRQVQAALLFSEGPLLLELPAELLDHHKPGFVRP
ncbi:DNA helicase/exodeoxyribonuclease V, subunit A [Parasphingorhabdus marina DSM 22363]|uniref:DNA 3'-5' helicase n=1 Tax=Parasphingorhabdus marina DSM 22363 TaxID=1123272 RepID=A0A1N6FXA2_9SPHN|nr:double-strand break repair helicase AddA [Parasphingorhabdus marina]SIN99898.1 DNA helicase/exodeoxyribonuclease V, subunit A [Parasphingorhabdus marina DSM 22363]